ncbi:hypothetical protein CGG82_16580 [Vibrio parahaemolyticus]|nr:hypothetical protein CGJ43_24825 [Vibrio parahaemolyticus]TOH15296.1 hypothetical protein CGI87_17820 [Vibrio parahaemolyticus]TOI05626.1 hypothetical protein CGI67_22880 [Vibrio parahaemolyticus]TOL62385.1 hypothetical protein CGH94_24245 [Vibrio parahaemolyticus]TOQ37123.1 hypothetical protein CGG96_23165 [Vibrio parahaemolyticus]
MTHYQPLLPPKKIYFYSPSKEVFILTTNYVLLPPDYITMSCDEMLTKEAELAVNQNETS